MTKFRCKKVEKGHFVYEHLDPFWPQKKPKPAVTRCKKKCNGIFPLQKKCKKTLFFPFQMAQPFSLPGIIWPKLEFATEILVAYFEKCVKEVTQ